MKNIAVFISLLSCLTLSAGQYYPAFRGIMKPDSSGKSLEISMQLFIDSTSVSGYYRYGNSRATIDLKGTFRKDSIIEMFEYSGSSKTDHRFSGKWEKGKFSGNWTGNGKKYTFGLSSIVPEDFLKLVDVKFDTTILYRKGSKRLSKMELRFSRSGFYAAGPVGAPAVDKVNKLFWKSPDSLRRDSSWALQTVIREFKSFQSDYLAEYGIDLMADTTAPGYQEDHFGGPEWYDESQLSCLFNAYGLLSYSSSGSVYSGGAHGYGGESYHTIDLYSGNELKLSDVFVNAYEAKLNQVAEKYFRIEAGDPQGKKSLSDLGHPGDQFAFPDEFAVTSTGIAVNIEDGIYMSPSVSFVIPYSELRSIIRRNGPLAWTLK